MTFLAQDFRRRTQGRAAHVLRVAASCLCFLPACYLPAQTPSAVATLTADLPRYYFASPEAEIAARSDLNASLQRLRAHKAAIHSALDLLAGLQDYEDAARIFQHHEIYLHLRCAQNRKDPACDADEKLSSDFSIQIAFFAPEILALPAAQIESFFSAEPRLKPYRFAIDDIRRDAPHLLPDDQQALLDRFAPEMADWQYDLYEQILAGIPFGTVQTSSGPLDVIRQRSLLSADPDPHVREEGFLRRYKGYASQRDLLAFTLLHTVRAQNALAQAHHYSNAPDSKYQSLSFDPKQTRALLARMGQKGEVVQRFEKIEARAFEQTHKSTMHAWDDAAPQPGLTLPNTSLAEAPRILHDAFAGLGAEYQAAFDALLDARNGRADIVPGGAPNRYTRGFSAGFPGSTSMLFVGRYDGTFKTLSVIGHEGGHAVHRALMDSRGVSPLYADGPHFLFESFAAFNELVLADYLATHASDPNLRRYYLQRWMSIKGLDAFYGAQDALLEQEIYDGVAAGTVRNPDDLDTLTVSVDSQFSILPPSTPELRNRWAEVSLMYEDPLYDVNYVYGGLLALKYYQLYAANRADFVPRYVALLKNGFDAPPDVLLKRFLNIDLHDSAILDDDVNLLNHRLDQLESESTLP